MAQTRSSIRLFTLFGVNVSLHWSWLLVAFFEIGLRQRDYASMFFNVAEYLTLFVIVLMHEFGHALACRSVGGKAENIMLWPLGGVAMVSPPQRPGAWLWSVSAGPLVNVVLAPVFVGAWWWASGALPDTSDLYMYFRAVMIINFALLVFNLLPVYPLDGGKILQSLLWYVIGRARSLMVVSVIGLLGAVGIGLLAITSKLFWTALIALYMASSSVSAFKTSRLMLEVDRAPLRGSRSCPACGSPPQKGAFWRCVCGARIDLFEHGGVCPTCQRIHTRVPCLNCGVASGEPLWRNDRGGLL